MRLMLWALSVSALALAMPVAAAGLAVTTRYEATSELHAVDRTTVAEDVAFENDAHDRMTVEVRVAGKGPYRFLVDTGADRSAISRSVVEALGL